MMRFLIQTIKDQIVYDFCWELIMSQEFAKWRNTPFEYELCDITYIDSPGHDNYIPVGSVEFVEKYCELWFKGYKFNGLKPLNVPKILMPYAYRDIWNVSSDNMESVYNQCVNTTVFRKSNNKIKDSSNGFIKVKFPEDLLGYQVSTNLNEGHNELISEWRVFVYHDKIRYIANYSGNCLIFPDAYTIKKMVDSYKDSSPVAYTLDVGVMNEYNHTCIIECHRFFSCGLYGFNDYAILPYMFSQEWHEIMNMNTL